MKLKTAIREFYDRVGNPALRADVVTFLRRYSVPSRVVTHYACRGETTKAISDLLESAGFEKGSDFSVISSNYDPEANAIRWLEKDKVMEMAQQLSSVPPKVYDGMYAGVASSDGAKASSAFSDSSEEDSVPDGSGPDADADVRRRHFSSSLTAMSDDMIRQLAETDVSKLEDMFAKTRNSRKCVTDAIAWAKYVKGSPMRPFILPLPVLEAYYRIAFGDTDVGIPSMLFRIRGPMQACRLLRMDEPFPIVGLVQAPLDELIRGDGNPMEHYLYNMVGDLDGIDMSDKALMALCSDTELVFSGGEDVVTPVRMAARKQPMWSYISKIYSACYPGIRFGYYANSMCVTLAGCSAAWNQTPAACVNRNNGQRNDDDRGSYDIPSSERLAVRFFAVVTPHDVDPGYSDMSRFVREQTVPEVIVTDGPVSFAKIAFTAKDAAACWFDAVHSHEREGIGGDMPPAETMEKYRAGTPDGHALSELSRPDCNPAMRSVPESDGAPSFPTPTSAFVDGAIPVALRLHWGTERPLPIREWTGPHPELHGPGNIIAAVYSGVVSEQSDLTLADRHGTDRAFFPNLFRSVAPESPDTWKADAIGTVADSRLRLSTWLDEMASDGSCQVNTYGLPDECDGETERSLLYDTVIETNVDAYAFMGHVSSKGTRKLLADRILNSFMYDIVFRKCDPYAGTEESMARPDSLAPCHCRMVKKATDSLTGSRALECEFGEYMFVSRSGTRNSYPNTVARFACDSCGRLVILIRALGGMGRYATSVYRFIAGLPLMTAGFLQRNEESNGTMYVTEADLSKFQTARKFLSEHLMRFGSTDYDGTTACPDNPGDIGPARRYKFGNVPYGAVPGRSWFSSLGLHTPSMCVRTNRR